MKALVEVTWSGVTHGWTNVSPAPPHRKACTTRLLPCCRGRLCRRSMPMAAGGLALKVLLFFLEVKEVLSFDSYGSGRPSMERRTPSFSALGRPLKLGGPLRVTGRWCMPCIARAYGRMLWLSGPGDLESTPIS